MRDGRTDSRLYHFSVHSECNHAKRIWTAAAAVGIVFRLSQDGGAGIKEEEDENSQKFNRVIRCRWDTEWHFPPFHLCLRHCIDENIVTVDWQGIPIRSSLSRQQQFLGQWHFLLLAKVIGLLYIRVRTSFCCYMTRAYNPASKESRNPVQLLAIFSSPCFTWKRESSCWMREVKPIWSINI